MTDIRQKGLPEEFTTRLTHLAPSDIVTRIMQGFSSKRPTTFRVNTLKTDASSLLKRLTAEQFVLEVNPWYPNSFILKNSSQKALTETPEYKEGLLYVQSLSSMLPPLILDPKPGERVLDIAAAPGSKTTQMATMMQNKGEIVANDTSHVRMYRLRANLNMQGVAIARTTQTDGRGFWQKYPEYFDKVLVDVPCSMEGRFNVSDPKTYEDWSLKKVRELSRLQRWLLRSAISATKPGGTIVYSTCTISPEENEEVIDWILTKEKGNVTLETIHIDKLYADPPIVAWQGKTYDAAIEKTVRIYPTERMEGFYIAKLKKIRSTVSKID